MDPREVYGSVSANVTIICTPGNVTRSPSGRSSLDAATLEISSVDPVRKSVVQSLAANGT